MSKKKKNVIEIDDKTRKALTETKVNIDDGWADDVPLVYPEGSWKPDDTELTIIDIGTENASEASSPEEQTATDSAESVHDISKIIEEDSTVKPKGKIKPFRLFMVIWLGTLSIVMGVLLAKFYNFLDRYEQAYQASRPYHNMDALISDFYLLDMDVIYNLMTVKPETNPFETEENVKNYMRGLLEGKQFTYTETSASTREQPQYYIMADGYIVAKVDLRKELGNENEYGFPVWYISFFEFYTDAQYSVRLEKPSNYAVSINGIRLTDDYLYESGIAIDDMAYFDAYIENFPELGKYYCNGFYEEPSLSALDFSANEVTIYWNPTRGIYEIPFQEPPGCEDLKEYAVEAVSQYAYFISQDAPDDALDNYFPEGEELLDMIKASTSRQYFTKHTDTYIDNAEVTELIMYTPNCVYIGVTLDQHLECWSGDEVINVIGNFCYVKIDDEWKICAIKY